MLTGWRYRIVAVVGATALTAAAVGVANHPLIQALFTTYVPMFWRLEPIVLDGGSLQVALVVTIGFVLVASIPLFKPRPRRILDTIVLAQKQVLIAGLGLATLGYFRWSYRLPRATLTMTIGLLAVALPAWFLVIRSRPADRTDRAVIVGDDMAQLERISTEIDMPVVGYLCPPSAYRGSESSPQLTAAVADGGSLPDGLSRLGGISKLDNVLVEHDIDTVVLAFHAADRGEFFGTLDTCHDHGVTAKVHRDYADNVLTADAAGGPLVDVDIEPWDPQDYFIKRLFDVAFATTGLLVFAPLMAVIAVAIKLDSPGPVLYGQQRTAGFGESFPVYKFRTMIPEGETATPIDDDENDRITRVGRVLRLTHLDELPQLWSILTGRMSVVGPRAVWTEEESLLEEEAPTWRKRWFVKPGLTGLAQINDAGSTDPEAKLRYDLQYIREQSFWFDLKIVIRIPIERWFI